jgi:uncharacterized membrane protein
VANSQSWSRPAQFLPKKAAAIERHYRSIESRSNFGFVILATVGGALVGAAIVLLIAYNWDDLNRATRTIIALIPLLVALALAGFVLVRRSELRPWCEAVAVFDFAAVAIAISLISQTYQIQGSFFEYMRVCLLLGIPIVYVLRASVSRHLHDRHNRYGSGGGASAPSALRTAKVLLPLRSR